MAEDKTPPSLDELETRIREARAARERKSAPTGGGKEPTPLELALRIGVDLFAAVLVGVGGGLALDRWLGTSPWGLIVLFGLGSAAGVLNVRRAVAGLGYGPGWGRENENEPPKSDGD